ncbi:DUF4314 domain-containing protein [Enterococcus durans]|uniref:DUF4314 domain-containing protein n=1 Tax=Enterococcus durans TaxID=53345 RepID=UPI000764150D|nr:DUF4314 domain-containing protein [Enterococcus durans]MBM1153809.1 DUF4314 domain-containing protein [Enterococcus durans]QPQ28698.1 DUF4314 domain-containing protein [Enterococcus durans]QXB39033.1 DUF4314 domain-containing protein [Enterococcus durans]TBX29622.1 DUF4314 domain-containing protein [Enterococcus durans]
MIRKEALEALRKNFPINIRVKLVKMDAPYAPPKGALGTIYGIDDIGSILVKWDNGSTLNVIFGEDLVEK